MDPLTHGLLGAAAAQALTGRRLGPRAALMGAVGGMVPDADALIDSASDPLLAIEFHRHFTHALAFVPVGGFIAALPWLLRRRNRIEWKPVLAATTAGYATHGVLDACTTYGTQLLWPFSSYRVALNWISIIDPVFTLALLVGVLLAVGRGRSRPAGAALALCLLYLGIGAWQEGRARDAQTQVAQDRGHAIVRGKVFPTLGNDIVWRSLYRSGDSFYANRIRVPWWGPPQWSESSAIAVLDEADLSTQARADPRVRRDFARFRWFSDGWVARAPQDTSIIGDVRYSLRTGAFDPVWGVRFHPGAAVPTEWVDRSVDRELALAELWAEIIGAKR